MGLGSSGGNGRIAGSGEPRVSTAVESIAAAEDLGGHVKSAATEPTGGDIATGVVIAVIGVAVGLGVLVFGSEAMVRGLVIVGFLLCTALVVVGRAAGSFWPFAIAAVIVLATYPAWSAPDSPAASVYAVLFALAVVALGVFVLLSVGRGRSIYIFERGLVTTKGGAWSASRRLVAFRWEDAVLVGKPWIKGARPGPADDYFLVGPDGTKAFLPRDGREQIRYAMLRPRVRKVLIEVAAQRSTITYEQLSDRVWRGIEDWAGRAVEEASKAVSIASDEAGEGLLNAVVVGRSGLPGPPWFEFAASRGRDMRDPQRTWRSEVDRVWRTFAGPASTRQQDTGA